MQGFYSGQLTSLLKFCFYQIIVEMKMNNYYI